MLVPSPTPAIAIARKFSAQVLMSTVNASQRAALNTHHADPVSSSVASPTVRISASNMKPKINIGNSLKKLKRFACSDPAEVWRL